MSDTALLGDGYMWRKPKYNYVDPLPFNRSFNRDKRKDVGWPAQIEVISCLCELSDLEKRLLLSMVFRTQPHLYILQLMPH